MVKRALLVGCNYPGEPCELKGSVNDIERMRILLIKRFGFSPNEILELVDADPRSRQPTGANIRKCLRKLVDDVEPGDVLFFHFSGHGTQLPSERGRADDTGYEECIVPSDMNLLSDDDFRDLVDRLPRGVNFTFIADACHSGGLIDSEKEQIGDRYSAGRPAGRPRPPGVGRPAGGVMELLSEGVEAYASSGTGGRNSNNPILNVMGQSLGSRFNRLPGDDKNREFDPQDIDAYARQPESPYERRYGEPGGGPERAYERRDPREVEPSSYEDGGSGYPAGYERREAARGSDRPYAGSGYTQKYMKKTPLTPATGYADVSLGSHSLVQYMQSGVSIPETGYAERGFGYSSTERPYARPGSPYAGGYAPEAPFGRPVGDDYGYPPRGAYDRPIPADDDFGFPPRGAYERPMRPADDDYGYSRPVRPLDDDYRYPSDGASRRPEQPGSYGHAEDAYGRPPGDSYDRYGERRQDYDSREDDRRRPDRESYEKEHDRRGRYGEGSSYEESPRYPAKYPSEYSGSGGSYGVYPETGERYGDYSLSGDHGYSGKPHHTPLKNKSLPIEMLTDILSHRTGQNVQLGNIHRTLYDMFGADASPTVKLFVNILLNKFEDSGEGGSHGQGLMGKIGDLASQLLKSKLDHGSSSPTSGGYGGYPGDRPVSPEEEFERYRRRRRRNYDAGILISACDSYETSADANPTNNPRDAYGALSNAIQTIIGESRAQLTNRQVVLAARKLLSQQGYKQHPCLYCNDRNADALFLTPM